MAQTQRKKPNFLILLADGEVCVFGVPLRVDLGFSDVGCYGSEIRTVSRVVPYRGDRSVSIRG